MKRYSERRIRLVVRKTRLEELISRYNTTEQAKFSIESRGGDFLDIAQEHAQYGIARRDCASMLDQFGRLEIIQREYLPNYLFGDDDLVVCLGQDGLVANCLKYLPTQSVMGVNPDTLRWDGVLLPFDLSNLELFLAKAIDNKLERQQVRLAQGVLQDGQIIKAVNDLFIGPSSHISARYELQFQNKKERQSSSGIIVSTGLGSTGWYSSLIAGARGLHGGKLEQYSSWSMSKSELRFTVREPFVSKTTGATLSHGKINGAEQLTIESMMGEKGIVFSDGIEADSIEFNAGSILKVGISDQSGWLLKK